MLASMPATVIVSMQSTQRIDVSTQVKAPPTQDKLPGGVMLWLPSEQEKLKNRYSPDPNRSHARRGNAKNLRCFLFGQADCAQEVLNQRHKHGRAIFLNRYTSTGWSVDDKAVELVKFASPELCELKLNNGLITDQGLVHLQDLKLPQARP